MTHSFFFNNVALLRMETGGASKCIRIEGNSSHFLQMLTPTKTCSPLPQRPLQRFVCASSETRRHTFLSKRSLEHNIPRGGLANFTMPLFRSYRHANHCTVSFILSSSARKMLGIPTQILALWPQMTYHLHSSPCEMGIACCSHSKMHQWNANL